MKQEVLLGLSGGVDSLVSSILLKKKQFEVTGITFRMWKGQDTSSAEKLAEKLQINHFVCDIAEPFEEMIINRFVDDYFNGLTPSPCAVCNPLIKWAFLEKKADEKGIPYIATGHYFRIMHENGYYFIYKGKDPVKDQSYFLWNLKQNQLKRAITPLGDFTKSEVKKMAARYGYKEQSKKKESMGICFLNGLNYTEYLEKYYGNRLGAIGSGNVKDTEGKIIGKHKAYPLYTIGQKKGLETNPGGMSVLKICAKNNEITAGPAEKLWTNKIELENYHFVSPYWRRDKVKVSVKIRGIGLNPAKEAELQIISESKLIVNLNDPAWAVTPGQPAVFYSGDKIIGGGIQV